MMDTEITTMSQKGQVVIPKKIRSSMKLKQGARLLVYAKDDMIIMKPFELPRLDLRETKLNLLDLFGDSLKTRNHTSNTKLET